MCKKLIFLVSLVAILGLVGSARGAYGIYWDAGGANNLWDTGGNWKSYDTTLFPDNMAPTDSDNSRASLGIDSPVGVGGAGTATTALIQDGVTAVTTKLNLGTAFTDSPFGSPIGPATLNMTGGTFQTVTVQGRPVE